MKLLTPQYKFNNILEISPEFLKSIGAKAVFADADNTLSFHGSLEPFPGVAEWIRGLAGMGIPLVIISNNEKKRIAPFAEKLGVPYIEKSAKPLTTGFRRAAEKFGVEPSEAAVIGDQLFTDVLGGNLFGAKVFLTKPLGPDTDKFIKVKRCLEKIVTK